MRLHHIGIATRDIEETKQYLTRVYDAVNLGEIIYDPNQETNLCMITLADGTKLELIQGETINRFVDHKQYLYHLCYEVEDMEQALMKFRAEKDLIFRKPVEAILFGGRRVAFVLTQLGIVELLEADRNK
jgi:methylmalonyl-CoA/ethylmalonyl-CoA epimerase